ncbi:hypothetical protein CCAX7_17220 [Capsulimonas corticalis]|uniref:Uncharacterized protein n=1 Tax=Capsulimonas corticalis TaxID=2219043 RepID=A0A402D418_9BACT|nr:hypothetical protein [Capsulimonas corticalis]BDI29671.1 hypothetical protein CCAX7_17220 [Capsulimonas corticalis]
MPDANGTKFQTTLVELGIRRVICVDDVYDNRFDIESIVAWSSSSANKTFMAAVLEKLDCNIDLSSETAIPELRQAIIDNTINSAEIQASIDRQRLKKNAPGSLNENEIQILTDRSVLSRLDGILLGFPDFQRLSPRQWIENKDDILNSLDKINTLFIFDENLGLGVPSGSDFIREITILNSGNNALFGLLSYTIIPGTEHDITRKFQQDNIAATAIPKRDLSNTTGVEKLQLRLRAAVLWRESKDLRVTCQNAIQSASLTAYERVNDLTTLEFDEVVFQSSYYEGVHEMDTLVRIYTNAFAASLREKLRSNTNALNNIDNLRSFRGDQDKLDSAGSTAWKLQREEYYDAGEYINSCKMPPEPGDIYTLYDEHGVPREYILIAPPCDLMIRSSSGNRKDGIISCLLCQILTNKPDDNKTKETFQLEYYARENGSPAWVYFANSITLDLWLLDLCATNSSGEAHIFLDGTIPKHLSDGWKKYFVGYLVPKCKKLVLGWNSWLALPKTVRTQTGVRPAHGVVLNSTFQLKLKITKKYNKAVINLGVKREKRIAPILQSELIRSYSDYLARPARPHSLDLSSSIHS